MGCHCSRGAGSSGGSYKVLALLAALSPLCYPRLSLCLLFYRCALAENWLAARLESAAALAHVDAELARFEGIEPSAAAAATAASRAWPQRSVQARKATRVHEVDGVLYVTP